VHKSRLLQGALERANTFLSEPATLAPVHVTDLLIIIIIINVFV